ncbi:MAG: hypothetical protein JNL01_06940 [Bdellovibrionales bacterium]|nr:hypothetical protein [Bdellovibrionales bacterium]
MSDSKKRLAEAPEELKQFAENVVEFLKDGTNKQALQEFLITAFKDFERKKVEQFAARVQNENEVNQKGATPFHQPGNLSPIMSESLNMHETERSFARGLKQTQNKLTRSVEERVEEINHLLAGLGGFSSQLKACFARSTVVFLEEEDPKHDYRERLIFSINLPNFELKRAWEMPVAPMAKGTPAAGPALPSEKSWAKGKKKIAETVDDEDLRTPLQATWDDAVNSLAQIIATTGLKPKYVKNDRHYGRFVMKQDLRSTAHLPDEYFSFTLDYNTMDRIKEMQGPYNAIVADYNAKIAKVEKQMQGYSKDDISDRFLAMKKKHLNLVQERDFFIGTTPDPNQLDEGLLFLIEVSTLKDYHIVKDRMQAIMTKYILHLSKIAAKEASFDPDLEYEMWKKGQNQAAEKPITEADIEKLPQYVVKEGKLIPFKKGA